MPPIYHFIKLAAWGGMERVFQAFWTRLPGTKFAINLDSGIHDHSKTALGSAEHLPYKQIGGLKIPPWPRQLRPYFLKKRLPLSPDRTSLGLLWDVFGFDVPRGLPRSLRFVHYDHGSGWKGDRTARKLRYLSEIDGMLCCSASSAAVFKEYWGAKVPIETCLNGLLPNYHFRDDSRKLAVDRGPRIGFIGRLAEQKGLPILLHALTQVNADGCGADLHFAGDGPVRDSLEELARRLNIMQHVHFHGLLSDPRPFYEHVDLICMPSLYEGFPLACIEAAANGCPVVTANISGLAEVVVNGETGICVEPEMSIADYRYFGGGNQELDQWLAWFPSRRKIAPVEAVSPSKLANALSDVLGNPSLYADMSARGLARAQALFSFEAWAERVSASLARLAG